MTQKLLVTCGHLIRHIDRYRDELMSRGIEPVVPTITGQQLSAEEMLKVLPGMSGAILGDDFVTKDVIKTAKDQGLKVIIKWGIGVDSIDLKSAKEIGVPVYNTPAMFGDEVADLALAHLLNIMRQAHIMNDAMGEGNWVRLEGRTLRGKTAGIIGLGSIGRSIADRIQAFGMNVIGYDTNLIDSELLKTSGTKQVDLNTVLRESDAILLASSLTNENRHLLDKDNFAKMKDGVYIVNVSRGPLIDEKALVEALSSGKVAAAGLDVFEEEPMVADNPLHAFKSCFFTCHNGSNTREAVEKVNNKTIQIAIENLT